VVEPSVPVPPAAVAVSFLGAVLPEHGADFEGVDDRVEVRDRPVDACQTLVFALCGEDFGEVGQVAEVVVLPTSGGPSQ
jgi:hypothetical protein